LCCAVCFIVPHKIDGSLTRSLSGGRATLWGLLSKLRGAQSLCGWEARLRRRVVGGFGWRGGVWDGLWMMRIGLVLVVFLVVLDCSWVCTDFVWRVLDCDWYKD
jgi:hypothetical protein